MGDGRTGAGDAVDFERGQHDARDVLLLCSDFERGRFGLLMHQICDVARGVRDLCERERSELHHPTHLPLRLFFFFISFLEVDGGGLTSSTLRRMARKRVVSASRFLASSEWPVWAPLRRALVFVSAIRVGKMDSRGPVPDMVMIGGR